MTAYQAKDYLRAVTYSAITDDIKRAGLSGCIHWDLPLQVLMRATFSIPPDIRVGIGAITEDGKEVDLFLARRWVDLFATVGDDGHVYETALGELASDLHRSGMAISVTVTESKTPDTTFVWVKLRVPEHCAVDFQFLSKQLALLNEEVKL